MELIRSGHRLGPCDDTGGVEKDAAPLLNFHPWGNKMGETRQVLVPDIGDFKDVPIIEIQVKPGDRITAEAPLITLESDKASMEVPSPTAGVVKNIAVKLGDRVSQGAPILTLELDGADAAAEAAKPAVSAPPAPTSAPAPRWRKRSLQHRPRPQRRRNPRNLQPRYRQPRRARRRRRPTSLMPGH